METNIVDRYVRRPTRWNAFEWAVPALLVAVGVVNLYAWMVAGNGALATVGGGFLVVAALYFTVYWQPVLYLLVAVYVLVLGGVWALSGLRLFRLGVLAGAMSLSLFACCVYLYVQYARTGRGE